MVGNLIFFLALAVLLYLQRVSSLYRGPPTGGEVRDRSDGEDLEVFLVFCF